MAGETAREFQYDALNRMTQADNNYASVARAYDALSRLTQETQSIRLDGTGFDNGWERDITL